MKAKLYIEGAGKGQIADTQFRRAWREFFQAAGLGGRLPEVVRGGPRSETFDRFKRALKTAAQDEVPLLLVDSETEVAPGTTSWQHLERSDRWVRPADASDDQAFLMVQVMETWFAADREGLRRFFGPAFRENALPAWPRPENVPKTDVFAALDRATAACNPRFEKGRIAFEVLRQIDPAKVEKVCPHARELLARLRAL